MRELVLIFAFVHVIASIIGMGPTFVYPKITQVAAGQPGSMPFAVGLVHRLSSTWSHPIAGLVFLSGIGLIWSIGYDLTKTPWLALSIALFVPSYLYAALVQAKDVARVIALLGSGPVDPATPAGIELARRRWRIRWGGFYMRTTVVVIVALMVVKPF